MKLFCSIAILATATLSAMAAQPKTSVLNVIVKDRPNSTKGLLIERGEDFRVTPMKKFDIVDNKFTVTFTNADTIGCYGILFDDEIKNGTWLNRYFYTEPGTTTMICFADSVAIENPTGNNLLSVETRKAARAIMEERSAEMSAEMKKLYAEGKAYKESFGSLIAKLDSASSKEEKDSISKLMTVEYRRLGGEIHSDEMVALRNRQLDIIKESMRCEISAISRNPSVFGLYQIKDALIFDSEFHMADEYISVFEKHYSSLADHPVTDKIRDLIGGHLIKKGNRYPDFIFTRPDGSKESVRKLTEGKPALIDLWASWCGPCRKHSIDMIPVYEKHKDSGFKIIAVARENGNTEKMANAIAQDGYPWESFVDINDKDRIWAKNGCSNAGGKMILIDADGVIQAIDPTAEEVEAFLSAYPAK